MYLMRDSLLLFYAVQVCKTGLKGEKEARSHAMETGHVEFGEY